MPLKDILVHVDNSKNSSTRLEVATALAKQHEAFLTGLYVGSPPDSIRVAQERVNFMVPDLTGESLRNFQRQSEEVHSKSTRYVIEAAGYAESAFRQHSEAAGLTTHWSFRQGALLDALVHEGRFCDVSIVGQPGPDSNRGFGESATKHVIETVSHPVLVVPTGIASVGERIMIAWDRSPLAARAIHNARPYLRGAKEVKILAINLEPESHDGIPGSGICEHLARHSINAESIHVESHGMRLSDVLFTKAKEFDTDLIVMGAYGSRGLRERILGGVTSHVIEHSPVALLLSH